MPYDAVTTIRVVTSVPAPSYCDAIDCFSMLYVTAPRRYVITGNLYPSVPLIFLVYPPPATTHQFVLCICKFCFLVFGSLVR